MSCDRPRFAVCTIASKNYLARVRVLAASLRRHNPDVPLFMLLADRADGCFDPAAEPFEVLTLDDLGLDDARRFCFKYSILELNTAVKPHLLRLLFARHGFDRLLFLDPDILVTHDLTDVAARLERHHIVLTPNLTTPYAGARVPDETSLLQTGVYNLGFLAVRRGAPFDRFAEWWARRLYTGCQNAIERGLFVDQKWMDLAPAYFEGVYIDRHPGLNVAHWNLDERAVTWAGDRPLVNGEPMYFFHFSGFDPAKPTLTHATFTISHRPLGAAQRLVDEYRAALLAAGHQEIRKWPYAFATFDNGVPIPDRARRRYLELGPAAAAFGDPFHAGGGGSYYQFLRRLQLWRPTAPAAVEPAEPDFSRARLGVPLGPESPLRRARGLAYEAALRLEIGWRLWSRGAPRT